MPIDYPLYRRAVDAVRAAWRPGDDGALVVVFLAGDEVLAVSTFEEVADRWSATTADMVARLFREFPPSTTLLAVPRVCAQPRPADLAVWRDLPPRLTGSTVHVLDVVSVGDGWWWAASAQDPATLARLAGGAPAGRRPREGCQVSGGRPGGGRSSARRGRG